MNKVVSMIIITSKKGLVMSAISLPLHLLPHKGKNEVYFTYELINATYSSVVSHSIHSL